MGRFKNKIMAKLLTRFPYLFDRAVEKVERMEVSGIPWAPLKKPLSRSKVAIVTTAGVHLKDQAPFDMHDKNGDPSYRELPSSAPRASYMITHDYYDHSDADRDLNIVFPIDRVRELIEEGALGSMAETNYGFMGHIDGPHVETLIKKTAPDIARRLKANGVDVVILTPG